MAKASTKSPSAATASDSAVTDSTVSVSAYTKKSYLYYAALLWLGMMILAWYMVKDSYQESWADLTFEEFLASTGWNTFNGSSVETLDSMRPGYQLAKQGARAKYPVVMIPGFVTTGLEVWGGKPCAQSKFRKRMWGGINTARGVVAEQECWREHMALDLFTGMDPEGIRLRAAQGFEAADYFMANYWVWGKLIENLADLGYDGSSMTMESYDWRLAFTNVEKRDGYFTRLKHSIEALHKSRGEKVVLAAHSMGSMVVTYFFAWVTADEKDGGGGGGADWVDTHVHAYLNLAGALLGAPKAVTALISGEMMDTSVFMGVFGSLLESFFSRRLRKDMFQTWGALWALLPRGGDRLWGTGADFCNSSSTVQQDLRCTPSKGSDTQNAAPLVHVTDAEDPAYSEGSCKWEDHFGDEAQKESFNRLTKLTDEYTGITSHSTDRVMEFLYRWGGGYGPDISGPNEHSIDDEDPPSPKTWSDPSRTPLPHAPNLKVYCMYGVGLPTERAYFYRRGTSLDASDGALKMCNESQYEPPVVMDTSVEDPEHNIVHGVKFADGDGSVPLISLGYLCVDGWKRKELNPGGAKIVTREYSGERIFEAHDPFRAGPHAADHVDILGNVDLTEDFLRVVTDFEVDKVETNIVSDIENIAKRINAHPDGGLHVCKNEDKEPESGTDQDA